MKSKLLKRCRRNLWKIQKARGRKLNSTMWLRHARFCSAFSDHPNSVLKRDATVEAFQNARRGMAWGNS